MSDTPTPPIPVTPSVIERTTVVDARQLCRLWTFTYISIGLNVVILAAFLVGAIMHHHHKHHGFDGRGDFGPRGGCYAMMGGRGGFGHGFHHFGGMDMGMMRGQGWGGMPGGFDKAGPDGGPGPMAMDDGPGMDNFGGPGMMGRMHGGIGGGPGMGGMMGGGPNEMPDPAKMTDMVLNQLTAKLTLTDDQKAKVKPIIQEQVTQMQKDMEARRAAMQKSMEDAKAKVRALLNADQQKQLDAIPLPGQKPADGASAPAAK